MFSLKNIEMNFQELRRRAASIIPKNTRSSRNLALDFLTCNAVLALCFSDTSDSQTRSLSLSISSAF